MALSGASRLAPVPLRFAVGAACVFHGYKRLFEGPTFQHVVDEVRVLGLPWPETLAHAAAWSALAGGIMLILGFGTRVAALLNGATLAVILWYVKIGPDPARVLERVRHEFATPDGILLPLVLFLACLSLVLTGSGALSLDAFLTRKRVKPT